MRCAKCICGWFKEFLKKTRKIFGWIAAAAVAIIFSAISSAHNMNTIASLLALAAAVFVVISFSELLRYPISGPSSPVISVPALLITGIITSLEIVAIFAIAYAAKLRASLASDPIAAIFYSAQYFFNTGYVTHRLAQEAFAGASSTAIMTLLSSNGILWINVIESAFGYAWLATYLGTAITVISKA